MSQNSGEQRHRPAAWDRRQAPEVKGKSLGPDLNEALHRALTAGLEDVPRLAALGPASGGRETVRLVGLRLSAELAERLNTVAQELGVSVSEVIRRAAAVDVDRAP